MSSLRKRWRVVVDGVTYDEIRTTAWDMAQADAAKGEVWAGGQMLHSALKRARKPVPAGFRDFMDVLDDMVDLDELEAEQAEQAVDDADAAGDDAGDGTEDAEWDADGTHIDDPLRPTSAAG